MHFSIFKVEAIQYSRLYNLKDGGKGFSETSLIDYQSIPRREAKTSVLVNIATKTKPSSLIGICSCSLLVSPYGMDVRVIVFRLPEKNRDFSILRNFQIISGAQRASSSVSNRGSFLEEKGDRFLKLTIHSPPTSMKLEMCEVVTPSPYITSWREAEQFNSTFFCPLQSIALKTV